MATGVSKKNIPYWDEVEKHYQSTATDSLMLAIIEADKACLAIADQKYYKIKTRESRIDSFIRDSSDAMGLMNIREVADNLRFQNGFMISDPYRARDIVDRYRFFIEESLFGDISGDGSSSLRYRLWPLLRLFILNKKIIKQTILWVVGVMAVMLFIADTSLGMDLFLFLVEKLHYIIRLIILSLLFIASLGFLCVWVVVWFDSRISQRKRR